MGTDSFAANKPEVVTDDAIPADAQRVVDEMEERDDMLPTVHRSVQIGQLVGEFDERDIRLCRLQVAFGVGGLAAAGHPQGALVLDGTHVLAVLGGKLGITLVAGIKRYKEWLTPEQWREEKRPRVFDTEAEVLGNGGTIDWVDGQPKPTFSPVMDYRVLIEKPENVDCGLFAIPLEGKLYAPAAWTVDKGAYKSVVPTVMKYGATIKQHGLEAVQWQVSTAMRRNNFGSSTPIPSIAYAGLHGANFIRDLKQYAQSLAVATTNPSDEA